MLAAKRRRFRRRAEGACASETEQRDETAPVDGPGNSIPRRSEPHQSVRTRLNAGAILVPSLGGYSGFVPARHWEVGAAYRRLNADQWFVGPQVRESAAPFGQPLFLGINSLDATITYGVTDGISITLTSHSRAERTLAFTPTGGGILSKRRVWATSAESQISGCGARRRSPRATWRSASG